MSWTEQLTESNTFKVKNPNEVFKVLDLMGMDAHVKDNEITFFGDSESYFDDYTEVVLSLKPLEDGTNLLGIISDFIEDSIDLDDLEEDTYKVMDITDYLQDQLIDEKQYITITCVGFEGRMSGNNSPYGDITFITKNTIKFSSLARAEEQFKREVGIID